MQANKCMQMSAIAYNLKKYLKFIGKTFEKRGGATCFDRFCQKCSTGPFIGFFKTLEFDRSYTDSAKEKPLEETYVDSFRCKLWAGTKVTGVIYRFYFKNGIESIYLLLSPF